MTSHKKWKDEQHEMLAKAVENLLHAAGCPTVDVSYQSTVGLSLNIDFKDFVDFDDDVTDEAIQWALQVHNAKELP